MSPAASESAEAPRWIGIAAVEARVGLERSTISRHVRAGRFPRPMYFGRRRVWSEEQIQTWLTDQLARQPDAERRARELMDAARAARSEALP